MFWVTILVFGFLIQLEINSMKRKQARIQQLNHDKYAEARETVREQLRNGK